MILINTQKDMQWLSDTHCEGIDISAYRSAVIHGNEDCPSKVELYISPEPLVTDIPFVCITNEENNLVPIGSEITRAEARKLSRASGQHQEPYRGYGYRLNDGRFVLCAKPDGKFYIRESV